MQGEIDQSREAGFDEFVSKPVNVPTLLAAITRQLAEKGSVNLTADEQGTQTRRRAVSVTSTPLEFEMGLNEEIIELREELEKSVQPSKTANCFGSFCVAEPARIVSTLPMDDPEMREIASELVVGLKAKLAQMRESTVHRNFDELIPAQLDLIERLASSIEVPSGYCGVQN